MEDPCWVEGMSSRRVVDAPNKSEQSPVDSPRQDVDSLFLSLSFTHLTFLLVFASHLLATRSQRPHDARLNTMASPLSVGFCEKVFHADETPEGEQPVLQILNVKKINAPGASGADRYR